MSSFEQLQLETARLLLRPLESADVPALYAIFSDPEVMRYWSTPPWTSVDAARELVARDQAAMAKQDYLRLGLVRQEDQQLIGHCCLFQWSHTCRRAEIGYGMARAVWGRGYMHEALQAMVDYGFTAHHLNRIEADIDPRNTASARSLERLGFIQEGYLRQRWIVGEEVSDSALYGLLRSDWLAQPARTGSA